MRWSWSILIFTPHIILYHGEASHTLLDLAFATFYPSKKNRAANQFGRREGVWNESSVFERCPIWRGVTADHDHVRFRLRPNNRTRD